MRDFCRLSPAERRPYFEAAQARIGLAASSIEKDFWVCWTLRELFGPGEWKDRIVFKGGTSLSKAWGLIHRFSEDLDLVINREFLGFPGETLSNKGIKKLRDHCSSCVQKDFYAELDERFRDYLEGQTWKLIIAEKAEDPDGQTLLFHYPSAFGETTVAYVRPVVKMEFGARSGTEPIETPEIHPYLVEVFPDALTEAHFPVPTIAARRTFWEKIMLLHEEGFRPAEKPRKTGLSRHYYDVWCLIREGIADQALTNLDLFNLVLKQRRAFFKQSWVDYETLRKGTLKLTPSPEHEAAWRRDYEHMAEMFFATRQPPTFDEILEAVHRFERRFNEI